MIYLVIGLCILSILWIWLKNPDAEPPELSGKLPLIGHVHWFRNSIGIYDNLKVIAKEAQEKDGVLRLYMGIRKLYMIVDPDDSQTILNACLEKQTFYDFIKPVTGNGLLTADTESWKIHRKLLNPAFNLQVLSGFMDIFNSQARNVVAELAKYLDKTFDHEKIIKLNNLETICLTATGVDSDECSTLRKQYLGHFEELLRLCNLRTIKLWLHSDFIFKRSSLKKLQDIEQAHITALSDSMVQIKRTEMQTPAYKEDKSGKPFLDLILELAKENSTFTDKQIREEMNTIIAAGHETNSTALTVALTLLGSNLSVQEKAYEEILQVFGNSERVVLQEDLPKLVYMEAIIKETLRLHPIGILMGRQLDRDVKIRNYTLKANSDCIINTYGVHRDKMWGTDANVFKPERWFDKDTLPDPKYYAAFGLGRRSCIGKTYALMAMKINLVHILRRYSITSDASKMQFQVKSLLRLCSGFNISIKLRST